MTLGQDFRYALRLAWRNRVFTLTVVATLALCIGANTAILSVVDAALVRPLAFPEPDRLIQVVAIYKDQEKRSWQRSLDGMQWEWIRDRATLVDPAVYSDWVSGVNLAAEGGAAYVKQQRVSEAFFRVLGVRPFLGRGFSLEDDRAGGPPVALLSHHVWQRNFGGDRRIVGRAITLRGEPHTVVGVMPQGLRLNVAADVWTPIKASRTGEGEGANFRILARLKPGVTREQARAQLSALGLEMERERKRPAQFQTTLDVESLQEGMTAELRTPLMLLWAAVGAVLLVGCVNIGGMLLARSSGRAPEMATRLALGASRGSIYRQLIAESMVPALLGGAGGIATGYAALRGLQSMAETMYPYLRLAELDWRVLAATLALVLGAALAFSAFPAAALRKVDLRVAQGGRGIAGRRRFFSLGMIATLQVALTVPLLVGAGVLGRTFLHLWKLDPGFDASGVMTAKFSLQDARYNTSAKANRLFQDGIARLRQTPGVESVAVALSLPYERGLNAPARIQGENWQGTMTNMTYVTTDYFTALRIPLRSGRLFTETDGATPGSGAAVVNQAFVERYLKGRDPLGAVLASAKARIVGVVGNIHQKPGWGDFGPLGAVPTVYIPASQVTDGFGRLVHTWFSPSWIVRSRVGQAEARRAIEQTMRSVDPLLPIAEFHHLDDVKMETLGLQRLLATLLGCLSALALAMSALGIYGLIANSVAERTREFGIRMALGSTVARAIRDAARPGVLWATGGIAGGCALALASERLLSRFVWGVSATDRVTFVAVGVVFLAIAALASIAPALRMTRLDPSRTLREE